jgi:hypothetical protein
MRISIVIAAVWLLLPGCHTTNKTNHQTLKQMPAALPGSFKDDYGSVYKITEQQWKHGKSIKYHLLQYNKDEHYFIARNDDANPTGTACIPVSTSCILKTWSRGGGVLSYGL